MVKRQILRKPLADKLPHPMWTGILLAMLLVTGFQLFKHCS